MRLNHQLTGPDDAPVVLLGPSLGTTYQMWSAQVELLSGQFRVVAFDHRGHGSSEVPPGPYSIEDLGGDVVELLDELGVEQASYVGISLGGAVGLWLAENAGDRFHRIVAMCPPAYPAAGAQTWIDRAAKVRSEGTQAIVEVTLGRWFLPDFIESHPDEVAAIRQQFVDTPDEGYAACCEALAALDLRDGLGDISAPVLLITADSDASIPPETVLPLAEAIPGARLEVIEHAAHLVNVSHPDQINPLLLAHLT
ncbi:MAG: 3-oxoadipate enol-lactonase [Kribbellaceae bacterium]|nr:3-oxoadipate enol-lactonase [Kribbellaceae bacterium]